jgi:hypothetical protein
LAWLFGGEGFNHAKTRTATVAWRFAAGGTVMQRQLAPRNTEGHRLREASHTGRGFWTSSNAGKIKPRCSAVAPFWSK